MKCPTCVKCPKCVKCPIGHPTGHHLQGTTYATGDPIGHHQLCVRSAACGFQLPTSFRTSPQRGEEDNIVCCLFNHTASNTFYSFYAHNIYSQPHEHSRQKHKRTANESTVTRHDEQSSHTSSHIARTQSTYPPHHILQNHINQVLIDDSEDQKINALTVWEVKHRVSSWGKHSSRGWCKYITTLAHQYRGIRSWGWKQGNDAARPTTTPVLLYT